MTPDIVNKQQMSSDGWHFDEIFHAGDGVQGWKELLMLKECQGTLKNKRRSSHVSSSEHFLRTRRPGKDTLTGDPMTHSTERERDRQKTQETDPSDLRDDYAKLVMESEKE